MPATLARLLQKEGKLMEVYIIIFKQSEKLKLSINNKHGISKYRVRM